MLVRFAAHEPVKIVESHADRPLVIGPGKAVTVIGGVVVLSEPGSGIAIFLQYLGNGSVIDANDTVISRVTGGLFRHNPVPDRMVVAARDESGPGR